MSPLNKLIRNIFGRLIFKEIHRRNGLIIYYNEEDAKIIRFVREVRKNTEIGLLDNEAFNVISLLKSVQKIPGDIAEVGVYKGGSSKLICRFKDEKKLHLFDTFSGLPELSKEDNSKQFVKGKFNYSMEIVKDLLREYENVFFYKGIFPSTGESVKNKKFSFVHLDVDLYESTLDALKFFYPRMNKGGVIISHDYFVAKGVKKAFNEFFIDKSTPLIRLEKNQCFVVKT
jgi:O-methyltransferase